MIADLWTPSIEVPHGKIKVELFNERDRCVHREEADNFISTYMVEVLKQYQRHCWGAYFPGVRNVDAYGRNLWNMPNLPFFHLACWNDASAEDAANERSVKGGPIVAAACRFPQGSPSNTRGIANISESVCTPSAMTWVFDWLTSTGNGTFQSVGWMNCTSPGSPPVYPLGLFPDPFFGASPLLLNIATATTYYRGGLWHDGTNWLTLHTTGQVGNSSGYAIYAINPTTGVGTLEVTLPTATGDFRFQTGGTTTPPNAVDLCKIGSDYYVIGHSINSTAGLGTQVTKYNSAGVQQWQVLHNGGASEMPDAASGYGRAITTDGTDLFVCHGSNIYKLSAATGLVTATLSPTILGGAIGTGAGIAYDGTNLRVVTTGGIVYSVDKTTGALVTTAPLVRLGNVGDSGTATSPFSNTFNTPTASMSPYAAVQVTTAQANQQFFAGETLGTLAINYPGSISSLSWGGGLHFLSGKLYTLLADNAATIGTTTPSRIWEVTYSALGSRAKLASPVVKDSSKTMKITYVLTFA